MLKRATCKGSIILGTACMKCEKCLKELQRLLNNFDKHHIPTHEEIMTKWWKIESLWHKVNAVRHLVDDNKRITYLIGSKVFWNTEFIDLESADIPPETS